MLIDKDSQGSPHHNTRDRMTITQNIKHLIDSIPEDVRPPDLEPSVEHNAGQAEYKSFTLFKGIRLCNKFADLDKSME